MSSVFKISLLVPSIDAVGPMELMLEELSSVITSFSTGDKDVWRIEVFVEGMPDHDYVAGLIEAGAKAAAIKNPEFVLEPLPDIDWVSENQKSFEAIRAGRYLVHSAMDDGPVRPSDWPIVMDAGLAFGTGSHATTLGCLLELDRLAKGNRFFRILDLGSGTGILAIAAARAWRDAGIVAADIDPQAVIVCRENTKANGVDRAILSIQSIGMSNRTLNQTGPYDLIIANILANPLCDMARDVTDAMQRGARLILSGLLVEQEAQVLAAYGRHGLALEHRRRINGWATLTLRKGMRRV